MLSLLRPPPRDRRHCRAPRPRHGSAPGRHAAWHIFPALCGSPCFPGLSASRGTGHGKFRQGGGIRRCRLAVLPKIRARASLVARRRKACGCAEPGAFGPALNWHRALSQRSPTLIPRSLSKDRTQFVPRRSGSSFRPDGAPSCRPPSCARASPGPCSHPSALRSAPRTRAIDNAASTIG